MNDVRNDINFRYSHWRKLHSSFRRTCFEILGLKKCPPDPSSLAYKHPELRSLMIFLLSGVVYPGRTSFLTRSSWARFKTRGLLGMGVLPWIHLAKFSRRCCLRDTIHFHLKPPSTDSGTKSAKILKLSKE